MLSYMRPVIIHILQENVHNLLSSPPKSFTFEGASFFPRRASHRRHYLTDDVLDFLIHIRGEDDWEAFARVAISVPDQAIFRQETYLQIEDYSSSRADEAETDIEARAAGWAASL